MYYYFISAFRSDDSDDELDDFEIGKIMIVTQTPPPPKKHDRTGNFTNRTKMTQELAHMISDGLYYYEQDLLDEDDDGSYYNRKVTRLMIYYSALKSRWLPITSAYQFFYSLETATNRTGTFSSECLHFFGS